MKLLNKSIQTMLMVFMATVVFGHIGPQHENSKNKAAENDKVNFREDCQPGIAETDQQINNVRARLSTGGDVWWNRDEGLYIVPKPAEGQTPVSSLFAGGVWVGGTTRAGSLKLAGVTYRTLTTNFDWYPGPLDEMGLTDAPICESWDQFFKVNATDVLRHNENFEADPLNYSCDSIPDDVRYWPGKGNPYWREKYDFELPDQPLGAFWDEDGDGLYDPCQGDFPTIEIEGCFFERNKAKELIPDEMIFWIYNDNGGPHRLTAGDAIQMEVQVQAFAYATNDEVNDMTFQRYRLLNKAQEDLIDCYFAMWVDPDLGCPYDDFSGCDNSIDASGKPRSLAYTYNEDQVDGDNGPNCSQGINTYRFEVPIIGTDYFRGPRGPKVFARDEDTGEILLNQDGEKILLEPTPGTGIADTTVELGMTSCIFTFNAGSNPPNPATTDPENQDEQFYNNMRGLWRTGEPVTQGGSGYNPGSTDTVRYMFDDLPNDPTGWSMCNTGVSNVDTRTLQATGPLLLQPGATNELIIGVVWVPDLEYPCPDISRLQSADDVAQALFDNCFDITDGPDAPDLCAIELDREIILTLTNSESSNNFKEEYEEVDLNYSGPDNGDNTYNFEGYKIYQLRDGGVSAQELGDIEKARLVYQVDVKNGINEIYNWTSSNNPVVDGRVWTFTREVDGADNGIQRTFQFLEDQFASTSDRSLINHKPYHFMVLAYAHNNWESFDLNTEIGQRRAYLEGRRNVQVYTFVPRPIVYQNLNAAYNDGAVITRISGQGNYNGFLDLADGEAVSMVDGSFDGRITYKEGAGPFEVKVFNPLEIKNGKYRLEFVGEFNGANNVCALLPGAKWVLTNLETGEEVASERTIEEINEQIIYKEGFSINLGQAEEPGSNETEDNGAIGITFEYEEGGTPWYVPLTSGGTEDIQNELFERFTVGQQAGLLEYDPRDVIDFVGSELDEDPNNAFTTLGGGAFYPYYSSRVESNNPVTGEAFAPYLTTGAREGTLLRLARETGEITLDELNNVDIVFTSNRDLWSRCIVVETATPFHYNTFGLDTELGTRQFDVIDKPSRDRNGNPDNSGTTGFSWFPGYAVDVETGQRLNIFFGENTIYQGDLADRLNTPGIANDMIFNPTSQIFGAAGELQEFANIVLGGQHYIYVTRTVYDGCEDLKAEFSKQSKDFDKQSAITWTGVPMVSAGNPLLSPEQGLIPSDLTIKLRVNNQFGNEIFVDNLSRVNRCNSLDELPVYEFEFAGKEASVLEQEEYEGALANVNVVPNPYYAYSAYENSVLVNTIKVTNLPERALVTIYTLDGKFIRQFDRAETATIKSDPFSANGFMQSTPDLEWDMKNSKGIPIASGVYLIHVVAPELGEERVLKWFGVNRQFDPTGL